NPKRLGGLEIDDELELGRLKHWKIGGLNPLENATDIDTRLMIHPRNAASVAHEAAGDGELASPVHDRNCVLPRKRDVLATLAKKHRIAGKEHCASALLYGRLERGIEFAWTSRAHHDGLPAQCASGFLRGFYVGVDIRIIRIHEQSDQRGVWSDLAQQFHALRA